MKRIYIDITIICGLYLSWFLTIIYGNEIPLIALFLIGGYLTCLHGSLQHNAVHGYPTRRHWLNTAMVYPPLAFFYPYQTYREAHLKHHRIDELTDVDTDPESIYLSRAYWNSLNGFGKLVYRFNFTLLGRLLIGPFLALYHLWKSEFIAIVSGDVRCLRTWILHILACAGLALFIHYASDMPLWKYVVCFVYPGIALTLLRSYTEHRWSAVAQQRTIIIEGSFLTRLLYLNNNYHWVHHENPGLAWQQLRHVFDQRRSEILQSNGNFYYRGYLQILGRVFKDRWIDPIHPTQAN